MYSRKCFLKNNLLVGLVIACLCLILHGSQENSERKAKGTEDADGRTGITRWNEIYVTLEGNRVSAPKDVQKTNEVLNKAMNTGSRARKREPINLKGERAHFENEKYGDHPRNTFDMWLTKSRRPAPLVIFIHGGGFIRGDKSTFYRSKDLVRFLDAGISVAAINYRFMNELPYGIKACLLDAKRCIQYIRYNAQKYSIDKHRIACAGGSAGAGTSLWLAFSDNMAEPENEDPVLREPTRLICAGAVGTQSTYDIFLWEKIFDVPVAATDAQLSSIAEAFGLEAGHNAEYYMNHEKIRRELDMLGKMDKSDPPIYVMNNGKGSIPGKTDDKWRGLVHHPLHAKALKERAIEVGLEAVVYAPQIGIVDPSGKDMFSFFCEKILGKQSSER
jgi:hypothetical protein